jgi:energy-coupling factor transporter ATP-binding protein EcfA2
MIHVEGLTYTYPGESTPALRDVSLDIPTGQFCAVVGANGSGKSTLCYALSGFVPHFYRGTLQGTLRVAEYDIPRTPLSNLSGEIGLVFQNPFNQITGARFTVREEVAFGLENLGVPRNEMLRRTDEILALAGLAEVADRSPYALSGGQQQRLAIASMMVMRPRALILDEPTSQLDPVGTREVLSALSVLAAEGDTTVVLTEHRLEWVAAYAERVVALADGQVIADGTPRQVLTSPSIEKHGIGQTRYTQAARRAKIHDLVSHDKPLPITLDQAIEYFK